MCVCRSHEWMLGRDPLLQYVDYCVVWIGKALYAREFKFYPGTQHSSAKVRAERDQLDEYCGCGSVRAYRDCCRLADSALGLVERHRLHYAAEQSYLVELEAMERSGTPPKFVD